MVLGDEGPEPRQALQPCSVPGNMVRPRRRSGTIRLERRNPSPALMVRQRERTSVRPAAIEYEPRPQRVAYQNSVLSRADVFVHRGRIEGDHACATRHRFELDEPYALFDPRSNDYVR